jgi:Cu(I)/Ag(I) efflux system periplasmic protein CusF
MTFRSFLTIAIISVTLAVACDTKRPAGNDKVSAPSPSPIPTAMIPKDGNYNGKGKVTGIDLQLGTVEIDHETIPDMMPAMKMGFYVSDKALLKGLVVGDRVEFVIEYKARHETIVDIKKVK